MSLLTSVQVPPQQLSPPQLMPQPPQLAGSQYGSTQAPPHSSWSAVHSSTHVPSIQESQPQLMPQPPQLAGSQYGSTQAPPALQLVRRAFLNARPFDTGEPAAVDAAVAAVGRVPVRIDAGAPHSSWSAVHSSTHVPSAQ